MRRWMCYGILCAGILLVSSDSYARLRTLASPNLAHCRNPKWSPDGSQIAYEVRHTRKSTIEIHFYNLATKSRSVVRPSALQTGGFSLGGSSSKRGMVAHELAWSPKGNRYLFSSNGTGTVFNIYLSQEGILKINSPTTSDGQPAWSKTGQYIAFTSARSGNGDLYYSRMVGENIRAVRLTKFANSTELFPVWSPTSPLTLAYLRHTEQSDRIYLVENIFAKTSTRLTRASWDKKVSELNPSWSPDGTKIAFYGVYADGRYDLFVTDAKPGSQPQRLARNVVKSDQFGPAWSPDGKWIFFVQKLSKERDQIQAIQLDSKAKKSISTDTSLNNELAVTTRDGKWHLAFTSQGLNASENKIYRKLFVKVFDPL